MLGASMQGSNQNSYGNFTRQVQPYLYPTEDNLISSITSMMLGGNNPTLKDMQTAGADSINRSFTNMPSTVTSELSGRGFGKSGKLGTAMYNIEGSRLGDLSQLFSAFGGLGLQSQAQGSSLAENLLNSTMGGTSVGNTSGISSGFGFGTPRV